MNRPLAIVTGAGSGIGRATTHRLARDGYDVIALSRRLQSLNDTIQSLDDDRERVRPIAVDVREHHRLTEMMAEAGPIQAVVANAGICRQARLDDSDADEVWSETLSTNLDGVYYTLRAAGPHLAPNARVVVVSSGLGKLGRAGYSAYTASKHALLGLVKCLAKELAPSGTTVNAVCPGWVDTPMARADLERTAQQTGQPVAEIRQAALAGIPLNRFVSADEVASLIRWLISEEAGAVTGQAYNISCGEFFA